jgi:hypothetical protein
MKDVLNSIAGSLSGISIPKLPLEKTESDLAEFFQTIDQLLPEETQIYSELKFEELVTWFSIQPRHPDAKYGAIAKRPFKKNNIIVIQVFLDEQKKIILKYDKHQYGRKVVAESLDNELTEAFGDKNVILVH